MWAVRPHATVASPRAASTLTCACVQTTSCLAGLRDKMGAVLIRL